jgi:hypothetical protein
MKKKTRMMAAVAMTGMLIAMTGCTGMCVKKDCPGGKCGMTEMKHAEGCTCEKCSMGATQHPAGCTCEKCDAM